MKVTALKKIIRIHLLFAGAPVRDYQTIVGTVGGIFQLEFWANELQVGGCLAWAGDLILAPAETPKRGSPEQNGVLHQVSGAVAPSLNI